MKKIFTLLTAALFFAPMANAQVFSSNFSSWSGGVPTGNWTGTKTNLEADSTVEITGTPFGGSACQMINEESSHKRLTTMPLSVTSGQAYDITIWVKGQGDIRTGLYDNDQSDGDYGYTYSNYISVNSSGWTQYTQTVVADTTYASAEFILSTRNTVPTDHIQVDSMVVTMGTIPLVSIYNIQYTTASPADSPYDGQVVSTTGYVTGTHSDGYFLQDSAGAWHGVYVYDPSHNVSRGDSITVTGSVSEYFDFTQIENTTATTVHSGGNTLPAVTQVSTADIGSTTSVGDEQYEGVLVQVTNAQCTALPNTYNEWFVDDGSGDGMVNDLMYAYTPSVGTNYDVTGAVSYSYSSFKLEPRDANDINISTTTKTDGVIVKPSVTLYPVPASERLSLKLSNTDAVQVILTSVDGKELYNTLTSNDKLDIDVSGFDAGVYFVKVINEEETVSTQKILIR